MGTWGIGILSDDDAADVYDDFLKYFLEKKLSASEATRKTRWNNRGMLSDEDSMPMFWFGLARAQWECGCLSPPVLKTVEKIITKGIGLQRWQEAGPKKLEQRKVKLAQFLTQLKRANPKPKKPRTKPKRALAGNLFRSGDCLAVGLDDGDWAAILVLGQPGEVFLRRGFWMQMPFVQLRYKSPELPSLSEFERRQWLVLTHHRWCENTDGEGARWCGAMHVKVSDALLANVRVVGNIELTEADRAIRGGGLCSWGADQITHQLRWERGERW